jgi:calmodulin
MAWSLSQEDRQCLRKKFLELDSEQKGTISQSQFTSMLMDHCSVSNSEAEYLFAALDTAHNKEIRYSEFLAAILRDNVCMREDIVRKTFARFDCDASGTITAANLRTVLGDRFEDADVQELITEADTDGNGAIDYGEFVQYVQNADTDDIPDQPLIQRESGSDLSAASWHKMRPVVFQNSLMVAAANAVIAS